MKNPAAHARRRGPGERANAQLKSWKILRPIRSCPTHPRQLRIAVAQAIAGLLINVGSAALAEPSGVLA